MMFWSYMLLVVLLIPAVMFAVGMVFRKHPPKSPNVLYGYRSNRSMKNQQTWDFAQRYVGKIWKSWGMILLPLSVIPMLFCIGTDGATISRVTTVVALLQLIPLAVSIVLTEKALKENFREDGSRKEQES